MKRSTRRITLGVALVFAFGHATGAAESPKEQGFQNAAEARPEARHPCPPMVNVKDFGAVGDGKSDDTVALKKAIASVGDRGGVVFFPPGHYLTDTLRPASHVTLLGYSAWGYGENGCTVISPVRDEMECLIDWRYLKGMRLTGLTLDGLNKKGERIHGVLSKMRDLPDHGTEQNLVIDDCQICNFSGSGVMFDRCWVWAIRRSLLQRNKLDGLSAPGGCCDGWIIDNQFAGNGRAGIFGERLFTVTITANRIEWNRQGGILLGGNAAGAIQVANCTFCSNFGPAIEATGDGTRKHCWFVAITGNIIRDSGKETENPEDNCHLKFVNVKGLTVTGNTLYSRHGTPAVAIVLDRLEDSVIANNAMHRAATTELIRDLGNHKNTVIANNPGSLRAAKKEESGTNHGIEREEP